MHTSPSKSNLLSPRSLLRENLAVFTHERLFFHVTRMLATSAVTLIAVYAVDCLSLLYLGWLNDADVLAAVGFASMSQFLVTSVCIGMYVGGSAAFSLAIAQNDLVAARELGGISVYLMALMSAASSALLAICISPAMRALAPNGCQQEF